MLWIEENHVNETTGYGISDIPPYETWAEDNEVGALFRDLQREHGRCRSKVYIDPGARPIGWVFTKKRQYTDCKETYLHTVWITLHQQPPTITKEYHYQYLDGRLQEALSD
jgi:hypothetical protein